MSFLSGDAQEREQNADEFFAAIGGKAVDGWKRLQRKLSYSPIKLGNGVWLAGGALRRAVLNQHQEADLDYFFSDEHKYLAARRLLIAEGFTLKRGAPHADLFVKDCYLGNAQKRIYRDAPEHLEIQLVHGGYFTDAIRLIDDFDFTVCMFAYDGNRIYFSDKALEHTIAMELHHYRLRSSHGVMRRALKYAADGFKMTDQAISNFLQDVADMPATIYTPAMYGQEIPPAANGASKAAKVKKPSPHSQDVLTSDSEEHF